MEYLALALVFNTHNIFTEGIGYAVAIETTHFEVCMEKLNTHTNTHAHIQRAIYAHTHIQCQQMKIYSRMLYNYFIYLLMFYLFRSASNFR